MLAAKAVARDFVADAIAHLKFIGFSKTTKPLLERAGVPFDTDEGLIALDDAQSAAGFVEACRKLRLWARDASIARQ